MSVRQMLVSRQQLEHLLARTANGDEEAFAELYRATSPKLYAVALRILFDREQASEVLQETYVRVWERAGNFDAGLGSPMTWMAAITRNRALDELRRRTVTPSGNDAALDGLVSDEEHPLVAIELQQDLDKLKHCLDRLEPQKRELVMRAYLDGSSRELLARMFNCPEGTVKTWLRRSLAQLKDCLER